MSLDRSIGIGGAVVARNRNSVSFSRRKSVVLQGAIIIDKLKVCQNRLIDERDGALQLKLTEIISDILQLIAMKTETNHSETSDDENEDIQRLSDLMMKSKNNDSIAQWILNDFFQIHSINKKTAANANNSANPDWDSRSKSVNANAVGNAVPVPVPVPVDDGDGDGDTKARHQSDISMLTKLAFFNSNSNSNPNPNPNPSPSPGKTQRNRVSFNSPNSPLNSLFMSAAAAAAVPHKRHSASVSPTGKFMPAMLLRMNSSLLLDELQSATVDDDHSCKQSNTDDSDSNLKSKSKSKSKSQQATHDDDEKDRVLKIQATAQLRLTSTMKHEIAQYFHQHKHSWNFNLFEFRDLCLKYNATTFMTLCNYILLPIANKLALNEYALTSYLVDIEKRYESETQQVIYHNSFHAADVLFNVWRFLESDFFQNTLQLSALEVFSALLSAIVHDVGHPGLNNAYQINSQSPLAIRYNDESVLEHFHTSLAFQTLSKPENNFWRASSLNTATGAGAGAANSAALTHVSNHNTTAVPLLDTIHSNTAEMRSNNNNRMSEQKQMREIMIQCVLGTDMSKHAKQTERLRKYVHTLHSSPEENRLNSSQSADQTSPEVTTVNITPEIKKDLITIGLHIADISNPAKTFTTAKKWAQMITEEFFAQGDLEKSKHMIVLPMFDREKTKMHASQIGFIQYVVQPVFKLWTKIVPELHFCVADMDESIQKWKLQGEDEQTQSENSNGHG